MNSLTELLKTETDIGKIKQSYEFWKAEGKQSLFIDISIAHSNKEALRVVLVTEGPEIFLKSYSSMLCKRDEKLIPLQSYLNQQIMQSHSWNRKKAVIWVHKNKKLPFKLPESLNRYLIKNFL